MNTRQPLTFHQRVRQQDAARLRERQQLRATGIHAANCCAVATIADCMLCVRCNYARTRRRRSIKASTHASDQQCCTLHRHRSDSGLHCHSFVHDCMPLVEQIHVVTDMRLIAHEAMPAPDLQHRVQVPHTREGRVCIARRRLQKQNFLTVSYPLQEVVAHAAQSGRVPGQWVVRVYRRSYEITLFAVPQCRAIHWRTGKRNIMDTASRMECGSTRDGTKCVRSSLPRYVAMTLCMSGCMRECTSGLRVTSALSSGARSNSAALHPTTAQQRDCRHVPAVILARSPESVHARIIAVQYE